MSGNGRDVKNIEKYFDIQKMKYKNIVDPEQVHGDNIVLVNGSNQDPILNVDNCDGLITQNKGIVLTVITADCAPILYTDSVAHLAGISHNGRKGTEMGLSKKMSSRLVDLGSRVPDLRVVIGPSIGACCYPINLIKENVEQLMEVGLKKDQIDFFPFCTKCDSKRFFSYRNSRKLPNFPEQFSFVVQ